VSDKAQHMYAEINYEYPVKPEIAPSKLLASWGTFKSDTLPLQAVVANHQQAIQLVDEVKFDL